MVGASLTDGDEVLFAREVLNEGEEGSQLVQTAQRFQCPIPLADDGVLFRVIRLLL